jgi:hypothetical protein
MLFPFVFCLHPTLRKKREGWGAQTIFGTKRNSSIGVRVCLIPCSMATESSSANPESAIAGGMAVNPVRSILRIEGLAAAALSAVLYARTGASWWLFAALWLTPDLSMVGYLYRPCWGARIYNAVHSYLAPLTLAVTALLLRSPALLPFALIWINHIGVDRVLGYGLKYPEGFQWTHLGKLGGRRAGAISPQ